MHYKTFMEALKGKQHKLDKNKNGKLDAHDFKLLRKEEEELEDEIIQEKKDEIQSSDYKMTPSGRKVRAKHIYFNSGEDEDEDEEKKKEVHESKSLSPGWMLKADPELAKKFKQNVKKHQAMKKALGDPAAGKSVKEETDIDEQVAVAPVPGDKWKSHAVMVNTKNIRNGKPQRVVIDRKHAHNYPEHEGWKEVSPGHVLKMKKEEIELDEQTAHEKGIKVGHYVQTASGVEGVVKHITPDGKKLTVWNRKRQADHKVVASKADKIKGIGIRKEEVEQIDELNRDTLKSYYNKRSVELEEAKHRVAVTVSDPNHTAVSKRKEEIQKIVRLTADSEQAAVEKAKAHYKKQGYKIHGASHAGMVNEETFLDEQTDDDHYASQSKKMQDAINLHLRKGKSYKDAVAAAKVHVKEEVEQIEERNKANAIARKMMDASRGARYKAKGNVVPDPEPEHKTAQAHNKAIGRALRREETEELDEKLNLAKSKMGDVIKDFQDSDAPQFAGKSKEKRRQMAIAAKLEADRSVKEETGLSYKEFMANLQDLLEYESKDGRYVHTKGSYGKSYQGDDDESPKDPEVKRGRGRPAGSKSGANHKVTKGKKTGVEYTGYKLHLPNK